MTLSHVRIVGSGLIGTSIGLALALQATRRLRPGSSGIVARTGAAGRQAVRASRDDHRQ